MEDLVPLTGEKNTGETRKAISACNDYLRMGPGRSLAKLHARYTDPRLEPDQEPPTQYLPTLKAWSTRNGWVERATEYDLQVEERKTARAQEILETGLALDYERVEKLKEIFARLISELEDGKLWLKDVKQIDKEPVWLNKYNTSLINDLRGVLDDLAKETGGRIKKSEIGGVDGKPVEVTIIEPVRPDDT